MKKYILTLACLSLFSTTLLVTSCGRFANKESEAQKKDTVRIVCVSKQLTEILFALGQGDKIVGIDLSSTYPEETKKITTVGYHRMLSAEGIISLKPTAVFYNGGADNAIGPDNVLPQLKQVGVTVVQFRSAETIDDTKSLIQDLGRYFNAKSKADSLCLKIDNDMKLVTEKKKQYTDIPSVMIVHFGRANNVYFPFGPWGAANFMIQQAGGINAVDTTSKFRMLSAEVVAKFQPQIIIATDFGFDRLGGLDKFKELPGIALSPAAKDNHIYRFEEHDLLYLGPRTGENILKLMELIHKK
jgi:iron complex transport system substrate-binding protein